MSWTKDLEAGKKGEQLVAAVLQQRGWRLEDVSNISTFQKKDTDFIITKDNITTTIEIKTDAQMSRTGNFFIEMCQGNKKGWYYYCEAEYLFYLDSTNSIIYIFKLADLRQYINNKGAELRTALTRDGNRTVCGTLINHNSFFFWLKEQKKFNQKIEVK